MISLNPFAEHGESMDSVVDLNQNGLDVLDNLLFDLPSQPCENDLVLLASLLCEIDVKSSSHIVNKIGELSWEVKYGDETL